ncbi:MAG: phosphoribosyltransferase [Cyclobacteriaceae bacterium]|nr:phosphoribosyltransferase [Cyclobacteriaceae bacterium]
MTTKTLVLNDDQVRQKIRRLAFQIFESNFDEKTIVLAGIDGQGYALARAIGKELSEISPLKVIHTKVMLDKSSPERGEVTLDAEISSLKKKSIVLVDDVLNSGRTLAYGMKPFLDIEVRRIEVAVLVNRSHPKFPIQPQYTGYELSTSLNEHVTVVLGETCTVHLH